MFSIFYEIKCTLFWWKGMLLDSVNFHGHPNDFVFIHQYYRQTTSAQQYVIESLLAACINTSAWPIIVFPQSSYSFLLRPYSLGSLVLNWRIINETIFRISLFFLDMEKDECSPISTFQVEWDREDLSYKGKFNLKFIFILHYFLICT